MSDETEKVGEIEQQEREAHTAMEAARARGEPWEVLKRHLEGASSLKERRLSLYTAINIKEGRRL